MLGIVKKKIRRNNFTLVIASGKRFKTDNFFCVDGINRLKFNKDVLVVNDFLNYFGSNFHSVLRIKRVIKI